MKMSNKIIDVLPPYEDEVLVSWVVRMLKLYSSGRLSVKTSEIMKHLFGTSATNRPGLYLQNGLQFFIEHCGVEDAVCFKSADSILEQMSVLPFYFPFLTEK